MGPTFPLMRNLIHGQCCWQTQEGRSILESGASKDYRQVLDLAGSVSAHGNEDFGNASRILFDLDDIQ